jgi:PTH1 family peptidyl-tRNA hydrolase
MRLIVGLGNPGERYRRTRHNVGFFVIDVLAARSASPRVQVEADAWTALARVGNEDALLVKPLTFMNRSGVPVARLLSLHRARPVDLLVVEDDIALELGSLRIREHGGHGGHNGLRSIIDELGTDEMPRLRIGIRRGEVPDDLAGYVLADFLPEDVLVVQEVVGRAADAVECVVKDGLGTAMSRFNGGRKPSVEQDRT